VGHPPPNGGWPEPAPPAAPPASAGPAPPTPGHDKAADSASEWARFNIEREDAIKTV